jgi:hypothetical protein
MIGKVKYCLGHNQVQKLFMGEDYHWEGRKKLPLTKDCRILSLSVRAKSKSQCEECVFVPRYKGVTEQKLHKTLDLS